MVMVLTEESYRTMQLARLVRKTMETKNNERILEKQTRKCTEKGT